MRYPEGVDPATLSALQSDGMSLGTAVYSLLLGAAMVAAGLIGRQRWIAFWGASLSAASAAYLIALAL